MGGGGVLTSLSIAWLPSLPPPVARTYLDDRQGQLDGSHQLQLLFLQARFLFNQGHSLQHYVCVLESCTCIILCRQYFFLVLLYLQVHLHRLPDVDWCAVPCHHYLA
jgi:hypothetical protein